MLRSRGRPCLALRFELGESVAVALPAYLRSGFQAGGVLGRERRRWNIQMLSLRRWGVGL
ncbi:MAG: hypothetical protein E6G62_06845 [Actinobacteria bacterium]|nr:MAG: hypothetical protein E6G62_06845 [Actinomycetota bacterium]